MTQAISQKTHELQEPSLKLYDTFAHLNLGHLIEKVLCCDLLCCVHSIM